jgi:hypothetical protein
MDARSVHRDGGDILAVDLLGRADGENFFPPDVEDRVAVPTTG